MTIEEYLKSKENKSETKERSYKNSLITRTLLTTVVVLSLLVICNLSKEAKNLLNKYVFETNYNFAKINSIYKKYILDLKPKKEGTAPVSKTEDTNYFKIEDYMEGAKLTVGENHEVKMLESGLVVFIGDKDGYGPSVVVQQSNGIDVIYGNVSPKDIKIYDYIEKGKVIGTANELLYLSFSRDGESLDYKTYIK